MKGDRAIVGVFAYVDDARRAIQTARELGLDYRVFAPVPHHELQEDAAPGKSPVRVITLLGAIAGLAAGFALQVWCALDWPLRVSAKPVLSIPAFVVVGYECTILLGALATLGALFYFCRLPFVIRQVGYDPRFSRDKFGVVIGCNHDRAAEVRERLSSCGAEEVQVREAI